HGGVIAQLHDVPAVHVAGDVRVVQAGAIGEDRDGLRGAPWHASESIRGARRPLSLRAVTTAALTLESTRRERRGQIYVALAAVAWSTAGVLQRQLTLDTATQVFGRAVFAGVALLAYVAIVERGRVVRGFRSVGGAGIAVALCV